MNMLLALILALHVTHTRLASATDTLRYGLTWTAPASPLGAPDSYAVTVSATTDGVLVPIQLTAITPSVTFQVPKPVWSDSTQFACKVWSVRRGIPSATSLSCTPWKFVRKDSPPPPPIGPVIVDSSGNTIGYRMPKGDTLHLAALPRFNVPWMDSLANRPIVKQP